MDQSKTKNEEPLESRPFSFYALIFLGVLLLASTIAMAWLAGWFPYDGKPGRPVVEVVFLAWIASAISLLAIFVGLKVSRSQRWLLGTIVLFAVSFRMILIFSNPILEVDFYRYLWDGIAANQGVSPYKFTPEAVLKSTASDEELERLQTIVSTRPSAWTIVSRVHFEKYTTLYPPVSQFFFRLTTVIVPDDASAYTHMVAIKFMLVLFDIGVIACLAWLISVLGKHPAWLIAYAWSPLVLKEIANGGHLDSIALFFFTAGVAVFLWIVKRVEPPDEKESPTASSGGEGIPVWASASSGGLIGLGIGAKLFPVVLVPALFVFLVAKKQILHAIVFAVACVVISGLSLWPMLDHEESPPHVVAAIPLAEGDVAVDGPDDGLAAFITKWRMNDALFSFVYQNVEYDWGGKKPAWYVLVPNETRVKWSQQLANVKLANGNGAYFVARLVTVSLFALFYLWMLVKIWKSESANEMAGLLLLLMAIFFFLQPTQNPWYWLWVMPFVCFAKNPGWLFVSLALFVYYLRFWFQEMGQNYRFLGVDYVGIDFYDHCVVWIEFLCIIGVLLLFRFSTPKTLPEAV